MFNNSKYTKWYWSIIDQAKKGPPTGYTEQHHIIPRCLGGSDDLSNLVALSARQHFLCHMLLTKMSTNNSLKYAFHAMTLVNPHQQRHRITSTQYEYARLCNSQAASARLMGHPGHNLGRKLAHKDGKSRFFEGAIPDGWTPGHAPQTRKKMMTKNSTNGVYYHNAVTGKVKKFLTDPGDPWIKGNPNADTSDKTNIRGTSYYHNPETGDEGRYKKCPEGWVSGRSAIWITNGIESKHHSIFLPIPDGWSNGRAKSILINDGFRNARHSTCLPIPDGWSKGKIKREEK